MRTFLLVLAVLALGGVLYFGLVHDGAGPVAWEEDPPRETRRDRPGRERPGGAAEPEGRPALERPAPERPAIAILDERAEPEPPLDGPPPDPETPVDLRDGEGRVDLVEGVAAVVPLRFETQAVHDALRALDLPPEIAGRERVRLGEIVEHWRASGFDVSEEGAVLVIRR